MFDPVIFREYDVRGVYQKQFDLSFVEKLGAGFVKFLRSKNQLTGSLNLTVGFDARHSSPAIKRALVKGMNSENAQVIFLGMVTSPISYFANFTLPEIHGGIMITGSHNPPEYNGFKISNGKSTIFGDEIQELRKFVESVDKVVDTPLKEKFIDIFPSYLSRYKEEFSKMKNLKVVLDCGNGSAGVVAKKLFEVCNLDVQVLFEEPDGNFPNHHPDPTIEKNLVELQKQVIKTKASLGIGFDGDGDRIGVVDENGKMLYGDELMVLISRHILKNNKTKIIGDVKCSDRLYKDVEEKGGTPIMWKTGHSLIKEKVKVEKAAFGGEMSGHIFFADRNFGYDDALYAGLRVCEIISETGKSISQLLSDLPKSVNTPEIRIDTTEEKKVLIVEELKKYFTNRNDLKINLLDGIRVTYPDGWALARSSNTQPVIVLRFEANSELKMKKIEAEFMSIVNKIL